MAEQYLMPNTCPVCGYKMEAQSRVSPGQGAPQPGNLAICAGCAALLQFQPDMSLKEIPQEHIQMLPSEAQNAIKEIQQFIRDVRKNRA